MSQRSLHQGIKRELTAIAAIGLITPAQQQRLAELYPTTPWNVLSLIRWFTLLGAVSAGAGLLVLLRHVGAPVRLAEVGCGAAVILLLLLARYLAGTRGLPRAAAALQLGAGFALQGLTVALAIDFSTGSKNWPALVGVNALLLAGLAYALQNRLVLIHALINAFVYFGGATGYVSGWGAYWLGMTYPARFLGIGLLTLAVASAHAQLLQGPRQAFARVYAHFGLLCVHLSMWFLALFGWFDDVSHWRGSAGERLLFSLLWAVTAVGSMVLSGKLGQRVLRSYGLVFLVINAYTFYFQFVVAHSGEAWFLHLLLTGGSLVAVGIWLERQLRSPRVPAELPIPKAQG
jgi:hypothetical protein